jgi:arylsulfatase A-like enzyme
VRRAARRRLALIALAAAGLTGCRDAQAPGPAAPPLRGAVLILLDTVRADHCSAYGYARPTTPALERLARRGALFENAISSAPWTLPAVASLLSGEPPGRALDPETRRLRRSLVEILRRAGIRTAAFTEGGFVSREFLFDRGFDEYREEEGPVRRAAPGEAAPAPGSGSVERTFENARRWLAQHGSERFFLFVHSYEPHAPYRRHAFTAGLAPGRIGDALRIDTISRMTRGELQLDEAELRYVEALYDGGIRAADDEVGRLLDRLEALHLDDEVLVVVTSDHGEDLGELYPARAASHGHALHDALVRVPLVIADPALPQRGVRVRAQVRLLDVLPTVVARLGAPFAGEIEGRDLGPLLRGEETLPRIAFGGSTSAGPPREFVRGAGHKYIERTGEDAQRELAPTPPERQLFDLEADPREQRDLAALRPDLVAAFARELALRREAAGGSPSGDLDALTPELRERLLSLGYGD